MVMLNIEATGTPLGEISDEDFRLMQSVLEEEGPDDRDYWIDLATIELIVIGCVPLLLSVTNWLALV